MKTIRRLIAPLAAVLLCIPAAFAQSFNSEVRVSSIAGPSINPAIAAVGSNVYIVWVENFNNGPGGAFQGDILFSRSIDGGATFSAPVNLTNSSGRNDVAPVIAAGGSQVHIFWTNSFDTGDVFYARSTNSGASFTAATQLTSTDGYYSRPTGAFVDASGNVHLAFYDNRPPAATYGQVFYACSSSQGASFSTAVNVTQYDGDVDNEHPRFAQGTDGTLYLFFRSSRAGMPQGGWPPYEQFVMRSSAPVTSCSVSWLRPAQQVTVGVPDEFANKYGGSSVAGANNVLHLAYWTDRAGTNLHYRRGFPNGKGWEAPVDVSGFGLNHLEWDSTVAELTGFGLAEDAAGKLHVAFGDNDHSTEGFQSGRVYYRCSANNGLTWSTRQNLTASTSTAQPRAAYANNRFHVAWVDWRDANSGAEIYYRSVNTGVCGGSVLTDLNGDGKSDLLWRNFTTGQVYRMLMNGFSATDAALVYTEGNTAWKIISDADFNGDGVSDLLWRNSTTGQVFFMPFNSSGFPSGGAIIYTEASAAWKIIQTPDIDGDGKADLLWYNTSTGQVYVQLFNGAGFTAQALVYQEPNLAWKIEAVGDFSGTGRKNQLVWRNSSTGAVYLMTLNYSNGSFSQSGQVIYNSTPPYQVIAAADFNGDGKSDILWRNPTTGTLYMFIMNGAAITAEGVVYQEANTQWKVVSVGDYNGDGKADLLWRNDTTGQVFMMLMNGMSITSQALIYTEPNTAWKLLGPWEYAQ